MTKLQIFISAILISMFSFFNVYSEGVGIQKVPASSLQHENSFRISDGWEFYQGELGGIWEALRTGGSSSLPAWEKVTLPHCYNSFDGVDPDAAYYQGPAWYRKKLIIENPYENGRTLLHFEGAGQKTKVYVYDRMVGEHTGGYDEFSIDLTDAIEFFRSRDEADDLGDAIPIVIRVDNTRDLEMIPSDLSDFNIYGGIYRYLNLLYLPEVSVEKLHINPVLAEDLRSCKVDVNLSVFNPGRSIEELSLKLSIVSPSGVEVFSASRKMPSLTGNEGFSFSLADPDLWSPDSPQLYRAIIRYSLGGEESTFTDHFGIRSFKFEEKGPFFLNGQRLLLRGTHRHEDHAGVGQAMTEDMIRYEIRLMKEMGVNFLRLGHYQQSRIVLQACDEEGILVWEEIPWCRGGLGGKEYQNQARRMLTNMISQHYNHPSVIIWGLGNENDWPGDFSEFEEEKIRAFMAELNNLAHKLDQGRKTAIRRCDFCADIVDVYSPSIWAGWYRGMYTDYKQSSLEEMQKVDHFLHVEWGASHHAGRHSEDPDKGIINIESSSDTNERKGDFLMTGGEPRVSRDGDWTESYAVNLIDWHLREQEEMEWLTGTAYWPFKDFSTPLRPENPVPYVNQKGVLERDFTPKESYYVFQSYWTERPMIRIYGHSWTTRWGREGSGNLVKVYSNCPSVELFLNGKSMGTKSRNAKDFPAAGLRWAVVFDEGENTLLAVGVKEGKEIRDKIRVNFVVEEWESPTQLLIRETGNSDDTATVRVLALDNMGRLCLDAKKTVRFSISGDGELIDNLGTVGGSRLIQLSNGRASIKVRLNQGSSVISASAENMPTVNTIIGECQSGFAGSEPPPAMKLLTPSISSKQVLKQMKQVADWQLANMPVPGNHPRHYRNWDWTNASLFTGISALYQVSGDKKYYRALEGFAESVNWACGPRFRHADDVCIGQTYLELYETKPANYKIENIINRMDSLMADPRTGREDWWWCDALYMSPPTLARLSHTTGDTRYIDYMNEMWWDAYDFLYDKEEDLFYRDDRFRIKEDGSGRREPNGNKVFWSRGNGWVLAGIARVLQYMPEQYPDRQKYIDLFREMTDKIVSVQGPDGLWKASLLYPQGHQNGETSGSGFFCYAIAWAINSGILEKERYLPIVLRTWYGMNTAVNENGKLGWVQRIGYAPDDIAADGTEVYGVGAYLLAGSEIMKLLN